jgi:hypothetical protein
MIPKPKFPIDVNAETVREYKALLREYDRERILVGEATKDEVNLENSVVNWDVKVVRFNLL